MNMRTINVALVGLLLPTAILLAQNPPAGRGGGRGGRGGGGRGRGVAIMTLSTSAWADGMRQISQTGPYYRGPAAPASGPPHHYVFELFALDTLIDVPPVGAPPAVTRAAVMTAITGHVRAKGTMVGLFKRSTP